MDEIHIVTGFDYVHSPCHPAIGFSGTSSSFTNATVYCADPPLQNLGPWHSITSTHRKLLMIDL